MDPISSSTLPSSPSHHLVDAYPNLNTNNSVSNHSSSLASVAHPPPHNDHHPSYSEMICNAIMALEEKDGSSKKAIGKYMEQEYKDLLPSNHDILLTQNLKYLNENNILIMVKRSYKFPVDSSNKPMSFSLSSSSIVPMGHDLPSKLNPDSKLAPQLERNVELESTQLGLNDEAEFSSNVGVATIGMNKLDQGCTLKVSSEGEGMSSMLRLENGKRVRRPPMRYQDFTTVDIISKARKRRPAGPPKAHVKPIPIPSATPPNAVGLAQLSANSTPIGSPKPRGRPKKNVVASPSIAGGGKKPVVARKRMKKSIRRPMDNPKVSTIAGEDNVKDIKEDLRRKYLFIRSGVRSSVHTLSTYFRMESAHVSRVAMQMLLIMAYLNFDDLDYIEEITRPLRLSRSRPPTPFRRRGPGGRRY